MLKALPDDGNPPSLLGLSESDQGILGAVGTIGAVITLYSESVLKSTGCGLPAGPLGLVGLAEGLSYLSVVGIGAFSLYRKVKTVSLSECNKSFHGTSIEYLTKGMSSI